MRRWLAYFSVSILLVSLIGCAGVPQNPVALGNHFWQAQNKKVGVVMTSIPKPDTYFPGADCLLCIAVVSGMNSSLTKHVEALNAEGLDHLKQDVSERFKAKGVDVIVINDVLDMEKLPKNSDKMPNAATRDFSEYKQRYGLTHLIVLNVAMVGVQRTYSAYVPTSAPQGYFSGVSFMVDLSNNTYEWYNPVSILKGADGNWDEGPEFPAVTNAYFQALETGKEKISSAY